MPTDELHPRDVKSADHMAVHKHSAGMGGLVMGITVASGETYDVEFQAESPGLASLEIWQPSYPSSVIQPLKFVPTP
jgi:hypothetical protein